jgi:hypothetical protein
VTFDQAWDACRRAQDQAARTHPPTVLKWRKGRPVQIAPSPQMEEMQEIMNDLCYGRATTEETMAALLGYDAMKARFGQTVRA